MGKVLPLFAVQGDVKARLIDFASGDKVLEGLIKRMDERQLKLADDKLKGSLCAFIDKLKGYDDEFAKIIADIHGRDDSMLVMTSVINYVQDFCSNVPKNNPTDDTIDNAYQKLLSTEMHRVVEQAIREALS